MSPGKRGHGGARLTPLQDDILLCLREEPRPLAHLRTRIDARDTSVLHAMKELESENLVRKDAVTHAYSLTSIGRIHAVMLDQLLRASNVLTEMEDFWLNHDISGIPEHLLMGISALDNASVVKAAPSNLNAVYVRFLSLLKSSKKIHGVSPIFHPDYVDAMAGVLSQGSKVSLIVTPDIIDRIKETVNLRNLAKYVKRIFIDRNLEVYLSENLRVALTVTESFVSLGLFTLDGTYDSNMDLMSNQPEALEWGERLFEYYRGISKKTSVSSLL